MLKRVLYLLLLLLFAVNSGGTVQASHSVVVASASIAMFTAEDQAQAHCPRDEVVWLNLPTGIYHEKGMRWYGRTKHGAFVCRKEADAAGYRDTRNGQ